MSQEKPDRNKPGPTPADPTPGTVAYEINRVWLLSGKKQGEISKATGIKRASLSSYLAGGRVPANEEDVKKLSRALGQNFLDQWREEKSKKIERRGGARKAHKRDGLALEQSRATERIRRQDTKDVVAFICTDLEFFLHRSKLRSHLEKWIGDTRRKWKIESPVNEITDISETPDANREDTNEMQES